MRAVGETGERRGEGGEGQLRKSAAARLDTDLLEPNLSECCTQRRRRAPRRAALLRGRRISTERIGESFSAGDIFFALTQSKNYTTSNRIALRKITLDSNSYSGFTRALIRLVSRERL